MVKRQTLANGEVGSDQLMEQVVARGNVGGVGRGCVRTTESMA